MWEKKKAEKIIKITNIYLASTMYQQFSEWLTHSKSFNS